MKRIINIYIIIISTFAILLTAGFCTVAYYEVFKEEVMSDLKVYTELLADTDFIGDEDSIREYAGQLSKENIRMTLIDSQGEVVFDNVAEVEGLENHDNRVEIGDALKNGTGSSIRKSSTINRSNFYYAMRLSDGSVLRTARETNSIYKIITHALWVVIIVAAAILLMCFMIGNFITKGLLKSIEHIAYHMENLEDIKTYKELEPIVTHIKEHHQNIVKNADMRQEFTANISHELKTPLTSVSGYAELIENGMANEADTRKFAGEIHKNANRLLTLINDIIRLSELDTTEHEELSTEQVDLYEVVLDCVAMLELSAEKHNVELRAEGKKTIIDANKDMIEELVYNLCDNAVHYNKPGGYVLISAAEGVLKVSDNGIGIAKENQSRVFERFFRVDKSRSKKTGGTGLGLAIVKHIVELHSATLNIESEVNMGTTITVTF